MHINPSVPNRATGTRRVAAAMLGLATLWAIPAQAQMPARFYWKSLSGGNAVPLLLESMSGNTNPFDPSLVVGGNGNLDGTIAIGGYARTFSLFDRSAMAAVILPMGRVSGEVTVGGISKTETANGFSDPMIEFNINLIGPKAQKTIPDAIRYEPGFSVDFLFDIAIPIGKYDSSKSLNMGQNRWYGRFGLPITWQLGPWVPGRRTTLELLPVVWVFGDNTDFLGQRLKTDPIYQIDAHLTRDFTQSLWGGIDATYYGGGGSSIGGVTSENLDNFGVGATLGYEINHNLSMTFGYKTTVNDSSPGDLRFDRFMLTLVYGWHPIVEGSRRLQSE
jgi:hypothetical protein